MYEIYTEKLIAAVKSKPSLYKKSDPMYYSHRKHKDKLWRDVCIEVLTQSGRSWDNLKAVEKVECVRDMQKRWKNLRTCFTREVSLQRKERFKMENAIPFRKRKTYNHFEELSFLLDDNPEQITDLKGSDDDNDPLDPHYEAEDIELSFQDSNSEHVNIGNIVPDYELQGYNKSEEIESKMIKVIKDMKKDEDDDDRQFVMSLLPLFRKLSDRRKLEARIEVLKVLQKVSFDDEDCKT
ncbi:unnamed protein product [Leptosia nina]|uniref:MADF domain-containing protein n=1 Tax=Leptosia nina TaxID=320188 RepID=A0AAV1K176_9NEOP